MDKYFSTEITGQPFVMFSNSHLLALGTIVLINALLIFWYKRNVGSKAVDNFRYWFVGIIFLNQMFFTVWCAFAGIWSLDYSLPLQLCDITIFLCAVMLIWNRYSLFEIIYFWGLGGAIQALLTPDLAFPFPHSIFFNFFLSHGAIITAIFYMIKVKGYRPTLKSYFKAFIIINLYAGFVAMINFATGGNYMFLSRKPENGSLLDILGPWPWYLLSLEVVCLVIFFLCYLPFLIMDSRKGKSTNRSLDM